jgi:D-arginine dehydrogenase
MTTFDAVVVGGGIAGLSCALSLCRDRKVLLLEREPLLAAHASGRNAAIFRPLELDASTAVLAARSVALWSELGLDPLRRVGLLLAAADASGLRALSAHAREHAVAHELLTGAALHARAPALVGGDAGAALLLPEGGVLDIHALTSGLATRARALGAELRLSAGVARVRAPRERVQGVELDGGERIDAPCVVLASGAWSAQLGALAGAPLPLQPLRRHLVQLYGGDGVSADQPVVWRVDDQELYFRPESGGVLCSPCDASASEPQALASDPAALELLAAKLARTAPRLANAKVRRAWACLRTFAPDHELVVGEDPRVRGLCWLGGLGGRGMGVALGAGELLALALRGQPSHARGDALAGLVGALSPARLIS